MAYDFRDNTYLATPKDDPKDRIEVEIGDSRQPDFYPQVKVMRWDNEVSFSVRLETDELTPTVSKVGEKIRWVGDKTEAHFYDIPPCEEHPEGGYEFEVILKEKPTSNVLQFTLVDKDVEYFYQPSLKDEVIWRPDVIEVTDTDWKDKNGNIVNHRPENVIGSYEIYAKSNKINYVGGKEYKCGKVGHIYRPKIIDSEGAEVWGKLNISNNILSVTIPQEFLDSAVYPVSIDPDFGYTSQGGSNTTGSANWLFGVQYTSPADTSTGVSMKAFTGGGGNIAKGVLVLVSTIVANGVGGANDAGTPIVSTFGTPPTITPNTDYILSFVWGETNTIYYTASGAQGKYHLSNNYTTPVDPTWTNIAYQFSIYCTYTAGGEAAAAFIGRRLLLGVGV